LSNNGSSPNEFDLTEWGGLIISGANPNTSGIINITIAGSNFYNNGCSELSPSGGGIEIDDLGEGAGRLSISIFQSKFTFNDGAGYFAINCSSSLPCIQFHQVTVYHKSAVNSDHAGMYVLHASSRQVQLCSIVFIFCF